MRILQVMAGAKHGGAETAFVDMCIAMHERGVEQVVVTRPNDIRVPRLREAGLEVYTLPFGGKIDLYTPHRFKRIIQDFKPQIIQSWMSRASSFLPTWTPKMKVPRYYNVARLGNYYKMKYFKNAEYFVAITPKIREYIIGSGHKPEDVKHINNFAETESVDRRINRSEFSTPDDAVLLLGLGRLHETKAFDTLIKATAKLPEKYHLWIAGEGPDREKFENLIEELNVGDRIKLLGWRRDRAALFQVCDICVFSSRYEPFGTVFVQAWAHKTPLVATRADGFAQFVKEETDGFIVEIDHIDEMAASILKLGEDKGLQEKFIENGLIRYQEEFTKEKCVQNYLNFYQSILDRNQDRKISA